MKNIYIFITLFILSALPLSASAEINYQYKDYRSLIGRQESSLKTPKTKQPLIGITSHHLPTASPLINNFYYQLKKSRPDIKTFVVIGPDHFEKCKQKFVTTDMPVNTMFGQLPVDQKLVKELVKAGIKKESGCFVGEHSIGVEANFIKKIFPKAEIVPILLSYSAKDKNFENVIKVLVKNKADIFVVESTDFTHYVDASKANINDQFSSKWIKTLNGTAFTLKQVDSPGTIRLILQLAKALKLKPEITDHKNSFDYGGSFSNTTSYFSVLF